MGMKAGVRHDMESGTIGSWDQGAMGIARGYGRDQGAMGVVRRYGRDQGAMGIARGYGRDQGTMGIARGYGRDQGAMGVARGYGRDQGAMGVAGGWPRGLEWNQEAMYAAAGGLSVWKATSCRQHMTLPSCCKGVLLTY